ncbi:MAG: hypothetical protein CMC13_10575 [Flavobacteriaceae bacterium]|nr:hypothetical protein [Flavobacteriaceae bacterium]|tara:strand:+ start:8557 stop:10290 length:1734 start_codon:yes stop_codon:yes gene_type:complete
MKYDLKIIDDYIKSIDFYNFQDFCDRLLLTLFPNDYTPVRAGGRNGDMKNDGYCYLSRKFFQAHATRGESARSTKKKIKEDLIGCLEKWSDVKEFIYITNDTLLGEVENFVDELRLQFPEITIRTWSQKILIEKIRGLDVRDVERIIDRKIIPEKSVSYKNLISTKFLITDNFNFIKEVSNLDLSNFPFENGLILQNNILRFTKTLTKSQNYRNEIITKKSKVRRKKYLQKFPDTKVFPKPKNEYQWKIHERIPSFEEIRKKIKGDCITSYLIENNISSDKIAKIVTYVEDGCIGSGDFVEDFLLRPFWGQYLILKNLSNEVIELNNIECLTHSDVLYRTSEINTLDILDLPKIPIEPNQNVIIPIGIFLDDFDKSEKELKHSINQSNSEEQYQILNFGKIKKTDNLEYIGPSIIPKNLSIKNKGLEEIKLIHHFDFDNVYWVDRHWGYGSCPHLFYKYNSNLKYQGEILNLNPDTIKQENFIIPENVSEIIIAELEKEITYINFIKINDKIICNNVFLNEGDYYSLKVKKYDRILIEGFYKVLTSKYITLQRTFKHKIIENFKKKYAQQSTVVKTK